MRPLWPFLTLAGLLLLGLAFMAGTAQASHVCEADGVCDGKAHAAASGTAGATRRFCLQEVSITNTCDASTLTTEGPWEVDAGGTITLEYRTQTTGAVPPGVPDSVQLSVFLDTGGVHCALHSGAPPSNGDTFTFHARSGCTGAGAPVAGTFELFVQAELGGIGGYDVNSAGTGPTNQGSSTHGALRSRIVVSALDDAGPTGGVTYAYGAAAPETIDATATFSAPAYDGNGESMRLDLVDSGGGFVENGALSDEDDTTRAQSFTVDDTLAASSATYGLRLVLSGNADLTGDPWTVYAATGHFAGFNRVSDTVIRNDNTLTADPRLHVESVTCTEALYNRGETGDCDVDAENARDEDVTRSLTVTLRDSLSGVKDTEATTGNPHTSTYAIQATDDAAFDFTGTQWTVTVDAADTYESAAANAYRVSSKLMIGDNVGLNNLVVTNTDGYGVVNLAEAKQWTVFLSYARGDGIGVQSGITQEVHREADDAVEDSQSESSAGAGRITAEYTPAAPDVAPATALGDAKYPDYSWNGNTHDQVPSVWGVSSLYHCDVHIQTTSTLVKDDFPNTDSTEDVFYVISSDQKYLWVHVEGVRLDDTEIDTTGSGITVQILDPNGVVVDTIVTDTGADGWTAPNLVQVTAPTGMWNDTATAAFNGNTAACDQASSFTSAFTGNLAIAILVPPATASNTTVTIYAHTTVDDVPTAPDAIPRIQIAFVNESTTPPSWTLVADFAAMANVVDWGNTVNGALYAYNFTPTQAGAYNVLVRSTFNATTIRENTNTVQATELNPLTEVTLTTAFDFWIPLLFWGGLFLWFLTKARWLGAIISTVMVAGVVVVGGIFTTEWGLLMLLIAAWLEIWSDRAKARREATA